MPWEGPLQQLLTSLTGPVSQVDRRRRHHRPRHRHRLLRRRLDDAQGPLGRHGPRHRVQRGELGARLSRLLRGAARMTARRKASKCRCTARSSSRCCSRACRAPWRWCSGRRRRVRLRLAPDSGRCPSASAARRGRRGDAADPHVLDIVACRPEDAEASRPLTPLGRKPDVLAS